MRAELLGRLLAAAGLLLCLQVLSSQAAAAGTDGFWARRSEKMREHSHHVRVVLAAGHAKLVVQRTVFNGGERNDEANFDIFLPPGAVAVGLRTLASLDGRPHWYDGELMEAEEAAAKYLELTGIGGAYPKDPALLSWRSQGHLRLQVFPCPPGAFKSIEYTLLIPTSYSEGAHRLSLPPMGGPAVTPQVVVQTELPGARIQLGDANYSGQPLALTGADPVKLALVVPRAAQLGGALASSGAGDVAVNRFRIEAAPQLSRIARKARIAVVFDASRSLSPARAASSVLMARSYLSHFEDAQVEIIAFDRAVHRRYGKLVPVATALGDLATFQLVQRNGSRVDDALVAADRAVSGPGGPARIVLFSDALTRNGLGADRLRALIGRHALLHIVSPQVGRAELSRDDAHPWIEVARSSGGLAWTAEDEAGDPESERVFEELARPMRIHHFAVTLEHDDGTMDIPAELAEGEAFTHLEVAAQTQGWVSLAGELWAEPIRARLTPDASETRRWSALIFGQAAHAELTEEQMMVLAKRGGAVSPVTSYLAIEPGVRPSTDGLEGGQGFGSGFGTVRMGGTSVGNRTPTFDAKAFLTNELAAAWLRCGGAGMRAVVALQTTLAEVVDVDQVVSEQGKPEMVSCLRDAVWDLALPAAFEREWDQFNIDI